MTIDRECDSPKEDVKGIRKVCQLMVRCDGHGEMQGGLGRCDSCQEVCQSALRCERY